MTTSVPVSGASSVVPSVVVPRRVGGLEVPPAWSGPGVPPAGGRDTAEEGLGVEARPVKPAGGGEARAPRRERRRWWRTPVRHYPDGVLPPAGRDLSALIGVVGVSAVAEAGWNVGSGVYEMLRLPLPLAISFPAVLEAAAASCAVQEIRDRRQGVPNPTMETGAYLGLAASAVINGAVGFTSYGAGGLLEILPPVVLGALFYVHGRRQSRAYRSRARLSDQWRAEQLAQAQVDSAVEALPLLAGDDPDGKATVALLKRRLDDGTLSPSAALIAAGWHDRQHRLPSESRRRRLETIAATVWPGGAPPAPLPAPVPRRAGGAPVDAARIAPGASVTVSVGAPPSVPESAPARRAGSGSSAPPSAPGRRADNVLPEGAGSGLRRATDEQIAAAAARVLADNPRAGDRVVGAYLRDQLGLTASSDRLRPVLKQAKAAQEAKAGPGAQGEAARSGGLHADRQPHHGGRR